MLLSSLEKYDFQLTIDGMPYYVPRAFNVINPATEEVISSSPDADERAVDAAVSAARRAAPAWAKLSVEQRADVVRNYAGHVEDNAEALSELLVLEQGKPIASARGEVKESLGYLRQLADLAESQIEFSSTDAATGTVLLRRPLGVVAGITAWNYPIQLACSKLAMAVLTGNATILKPSPYTPLTTLALGEIARDVFPPGVVSVLTGLEPLGEIITRQEGIAKIGFTGSTQTGCAIAKATSSRLTRLTLELGGNDAAIVMPDVDLREAARGILGSALENTGQLCNAIKRVYVHHSIKNDLLEELIKVAQSYVLGNGLDTSTTLGPIQNEMQFNRLLELKNKTHGEGGIFHCGSEEVDGLGYFMAPAIISGLDDSASLVREEQFGPLVPVMSFSDVEDAIMRANDSMFGLGASIWTADEKTAMEHAVLFDVGSVWINHHSALSPSFPSGGCKLSGLGVEYGVEGLAEYTQHQVIRVVR